MTQGNLLLAYGYLTKGNLDKAKTYINAVLADDSANFYAYLFAEIVK